MPNGNATIYRGRRTADIVNIVAAIPCAFFTLTRYVMYSRRQLWPGHRNCWIELLTVSESDFSRLAVSRLRRRQVGSRECLRQRATARASLHFRSGKAEGRGFAARKCRCAERDCRRRFSIFFDNIVLAFSYCSRAGLSLPQCIRYLARSHWQVGISLELDRSSWLPITCHCFLF